MFVYRVFQRCGAGAVAVLSSLIREPASMLQAIDDAGDDDDASMMTTMISNFSRA